MMRPVAGNLHQLVRVGDGLNLLDLNGPLTTRREHTAWSDVAGPRLGFANRANELGRSIAGSAELVVAAEVLVGEPGRRAVPVTFGGASSTRVAPGDFAWSDPVGVRLREGEVFATCTVAQARGGPLPLGSASDADSGEWSERGDLRCVGSRDDRRSAAGGEPGNTLMPPSAGYGYSPWLIAGEPLRARDPFLVVLGDSNAVGFGDRRGTARHFGWVRRGLEIRCDVVNLAVSGAVASGGLAFPLPPELRPASAIVALGTNDLQGAVDAPTLRARLEDAWQDALSWTDGVVGATLPPLTTSIDAWTSVEGQRPFPAAAARREVNAWLRSCPAPLAGLIDLAAAVETSGDRWRPGMTFDGVHPSPAGHAALAAAAGAWLHSFR